MTTTLQDQASQLADYLVRAERVLFITGAGISAESGLPTYRGVGGLYEGTATELGMPIEVALSGPVFEMDPSITWQYIARLEQAVRDAVHNRAHAIISELEDYFDEVVVLTQNVDGFHRAAGSSEVIDIHGDCHDLMCTGCGYYRTVSDYAGLEIPPPCPECGTILRPDVVLFGEMLPTRKVRRLAAELERGFDAYFSIGTTSVFPYIAEPVVRGRLAGVPTVEINPGESEVTHLVSHRFTTGAIEALGAIHEALLRRRAH